MGGWCSDQCGVHKGDERGVDEMKMMREGYACQGQQRREGDREQRMRLQTGDQGQNADIGR